MALRRGGGSLRVAGTLPRGIVPASGLEGALQAPCCAVPSGRVPATRMGPAAGWGLEHGEEASGHALERNRIGAFLSKEFPSDFANFMRERCFVLPSRAGERDGEYFFNRVVFDEDDAVGQGRCFLN